MSQTLTDQVADKLVQYILDNHVEVGDKLPNEYELASILAVSRSTVREAVRRLTARNILEVRQGSGTYLSSKRGVADDPLGFSFIKDSYKLTLDLFEIRLLLEPQVAAMAAQNGSPEQCQQLKEIVEEIEKSYDRGDTNHIELDVQLHALLAKMSGNLAIDSLLPVIHQSIILINDNIASEELKHESQLQHRKILEAILERDSIKASRAMLTHILQVSSAFEK
ncbi:FadR family transcriptional regulator [Streptococcus gallolyticus]|nr:FadR family transcriptional regulator [Streptococcus gallolyticus]MBY5041227.1 FadR family transcriptional regulator [Streptococcus gallolyticus]